MDEWLHLPRWALDTFLLRMKPIRAREELRLLNVHALGSGNLKKEDYSRLITRLEEEAEEKEEKKVIVPRPAGVVKKTLQWLGRASDSGVISNYRKRGLVK